MSTHTSVVLSGPTEPRAEAGHEHVRVEFSYPGFSGAGSDLILIMSEHQAEALHFQLAAVLMDRDMAKRELEEMTR